MMTQYRTDGAEERGLYKTSAEVLTLALRSGKDGKVHSQNAVYCHDHHMCPVYRQERQLARNLFHPGSHWRWVR